MKLSEWQQIIKEIDSLIVQASNPDGSDSWQTFPIGMSWQYALESCSPKETQIGSHENLVLCSITPGTDARRRPFGVNRDSIVRTLEGADIFNYRVDHSHYYKALPNYKFIISPEGNGIDCHRHYEALLAGCIPIIERNQLTEEKYKGCPILWTVAYYEITPAYLEDVYSEMLTTDYDFSSLFLSNYTQEVQNKIKQYGNYWTQQLAGKVWYTL